MIFEIFGDGMYIEACDENGHSNTGKYTMTYIEEEMAGTLVDYLGNKSTYHELSAIHMEPQAYFMSQVGDYIKYLKGIQYVEL